MTLEILQRDMIMYWKAGKAFQKNVMIGMIDAVKKAAMTPKGRVEITEQFVNETLMKYQKTVQEQYDTCPESSEDPKRDAELKERKADYLAELTLVKEYAPQLMNSYENIKNVVLVAATGLELTKSNKGQLMKRVVPLLKGKADMSVVNKVVEDLLK